MCEVAYPLRDSVFSPDGEVMTVVEAMTEFNCREVIEGYFDQTDAAACFVSILRNVSHCTPKYHGSRTSGGRIL